MTFINKKGIQKDPGVLKGVIVLVFFALITAFIFNTLSPHGIALFGQWDPQKGVISANPETSGAGHFTQIHSSKQVADIIREKNCLIIDVRARDLFEQGHIPTALSFPLNEFDENLPGMTARINQHDPVLLYCSSVYCTDSHTFADNLKSMGYKDIKIFSGGFAQWQEEGHKIETHEK